MENFETYDIVKILHIISFTAWFAGLFYLPRLFVYHTQNQNDKKLNEVFKIMEFKLYRYIISPAMIATFVFGLWLASYYDFAFAWIHIKITLVLLLAGFNHYLGYVRKQFLNDKNQKSEKFYRAINEIPTIFLILIVAIVILKPFS